MELPNNKGVLALIILLILAGGGGALYFLFKPKKKEEQLKNTPTEKIEEKPPVEGRDSLAGYKMPDNKIKDLFYDDTKEEPKTTALLLDSDEASNLIDETAKDMQNDPDVSKLIRKKYEIGKNIINQSFSDKKKEKLKYMFSRISGVDEEDYTTYPIYGEYEQLTSSLRRDLIAFNQVSFNDHNLTKKRKDSTWWFDSIGINVIFGSSKSHNYTAHEIWAGKVDERYLDFYKVVNGHDVSNILLIEKFKGGKSAYRAGGTYTLVSNWLNEMERFDLMTKEYAIDYLIQNGKIVRNADDKPNDKKGKMAL